MKCLLFSDLHCDTVAAQRLVELASQADVVIGAGDFAVCREGLPGIIGALSAITKPTIIVPGNAESEEELRAACESWPAAHVLHGNGVEVQGVEFFGLGGGIPVTPFGSWSFDLTEDEAAVRLSNCPHGGVLVTHSPPKGAVDNGSRGNSLGSTAIRTVVERAQPRLSVCGHIHDSAGQTARIGSTTVVNAGPAGILWDLETAEFLTAG